MQLKQSISYDGAPTWVQGMRPLTSHICKVSRLPRRSLRIIPGRFHELGVDNSLCIDSLHVRHEESGSTIYSQGANITDDDPAIKIRAHNSDVTPGKVRTRTHLRTARPVSLLSTGHLVEFRTG